MKPIPFFKRNPNPNPLSDSASEILSIPDDVMICIFQRLDVRFIVRCRCVCKRWKDLTSTPQFLDSLLLMPISNLPMILHRIHNKASAVELFCIDKWWGTKPLIHNIACDCIVNTRRDQPLPYCSQNVFTLTCYPRKAPTHNIRNIMVWPKEYIVRNLLTHEQVKIIFHGKPDAAGVPGIFGIFLHPIRKEYCTLWRVQESSADHYRTQYKMLDLGSGYSNCWRNIGDIWSHCWVARSSIICLDGFMYWMVYYDRYGFDKRIIAFDMKTEEFTTISIPSSEEGESISNTNLLNADGFLSLVRVIFYNPNDEVITIKKWTLKDPQTRLWTASGDYVFDQSDCSKVTSKLMILMAVAIVNSELVVEGILEDKVGLFVCNLESGTIRNFSQNNYSWGDMFWAHQSSIASLRNCQPVMHINV